jgi:predicted DNA-binding transcriptional regulator AlpA
MSEFDYDKLADTIAQKLRLLPPPDKIIWTGKQCADYLGISEKHFVDRLSKSFNFPEPIKLPSETGRRGHSRWYATEIMNWVSQHKQAS